MGGFLLLISDFRVLEYSSGLNGTLTRQADMGLSATPRTSVGGLDLVHGLGSPTCFSSAGERSKPQWTGTTGLGATDVGTSFYIRRISLKENNWGKREKNQGKKEKIQLGCNRTQHSGNRGFGTPTYFVAPSDATALSVGLSKGGAGKVAVSFF